MNDDSVWVALSFCFFFFFFAGLVLGVVTGALFEGGTYKAQAIERGHAQYCPNNGNWEWVGECGE